MAREKRSREERETEFIDYIELVLGFQLMPWQKPLLLEIRNSAVSGQALREGALCTCPSGSSIASEKFHIWGCPERSRNKRTNGVK